MRTLHVTSDNKSYIVKRYCDYVVSRMDTEDIYNEFKDYFFKEKMSYPIDTLVNEIQRYCPDILVDNFAENVIGKHDEYSLNNHLEINSPS